MALTRPTETILDLTVTDAAIVVATPTVGADVATATALTLTAGDHFNITGTTTMTSIATHSPKRVWLVSTGAAIFTHHASNMINLTGANITTAAGDVSEWFEYASGQWIMLSYQRADGSALVSATPAALGTADYTSGEIAVATDTLVTSAHSLGAVPRLVSVRLVCKVAASGYSIGDEIDATDLKGSSPDQGLAVSSNATNVFIATASVVNVIAKDSFDDSGVATTDWRWVIRAWA